MNTLTQFFQSTQVLALLFAFLIFLTTIFLVVKRWIGFPVTLLLLLFSLAVGLLINYQQVFQDYFSGHSISSSISEEPQDSFQKQIVKALEDLKKEVNTEKENLRKVMNQVQEIFTSIEEQKQKLQNFIEETRENFKSNYPTKPLNQSEEYSESRENK